MAIHFILHSAIIGPTTWSISCCRPAVLLLAVILLLLYCQRRSYGEWLRTINRYVPAPHTFLRSFRRPGLAKCKLSRVEAERPTIIQPRFIYIHMSTYQRVSILKTAGRCDFSMLEHDHRHVSHFISPPSVRVAFGVTC